MSPIHIMSTFVQVMTWCSKGDKPLTEPIPIHFTDAYMCHLFKQFKKTLFFSQISDWKNLTFIYEKQVLGT